MRYLLAGSDYFGSMSDDPIKEAFVCLTSSLTIFSALRKCHSPLKGVICDISGGTLPRHDQPPLIEQQTQFAADNPPVIGEAFPTDLLGTPAFAHGVDQLDAVGVDDPEHRRGGQEDLRPVLMRPEEAKEPRALRKLRKQRPIVARQPAIKRTVADTFEGMQQPQGDHLTGPEASLGMFGDGA